MGQLLVGKFDWITFHAAGDLRFGNDLREMLAHYAKFSKAGYAQPRTKILHPAHAIGGAIQVPTHRRTPVLGTSHQLLQQRSEGGRHRFRILAQEGNGTRHIPGAQVQVILVLIHIPAVHVQIPAKASAIFRLWLATLGANHDFPTVIWSDTEYGTTPGTVPGGGDVVPPTVRIAMAHLQGNASPGTTSVLVNGVESLDAATGTWSALVPTPVGGTTVNIEAASGTRRVVRRIVISP